MAAAATAILSGTSCIAFYDNSMPPGAGADAADADAGLSDDSHDADADFGNACGGWGPLEHRPGDPCGPCDLDQWICNGTETVNCDGATATCECEANDHQGCIDGDPYWFDSCGARGELLDHCTGDASCADLGATAACCSPDIELRCSDGDIYWFDSCDRRGELVEDCSGGETCLDADTAPTCECTANDHQDCVDGDVYWFDSCGFPGMLVDTCTPEEPCTDAGAAATCGRPIGAPCGVNADCPSANCSSGYCAPAGFITLNPSPPRTFTVGSPSEELGRYADETQHSVTLSRWFFLSAAEATQGEWDASNGTAANPSYLASCAECPVEQVDWFSAVAFANARSAEEGLVPCYTLPSCGDEVSEWGCGDTPCSTETVIFSGLSCAGYRLPTESEWEYAYRAGTETAFYSGAFTVLFGGDPGLDAIAWYYSNSGYTIHPARERSANPWGLYDMAGNVWEWTWDRYGTYPPARTDPLGASSGSSRVSRGGAFDAFAYSCRAAGRYARDPASRDNNLGFRLARSGPAH